MAENPPCVMFPRRVEPWLFHIGNPRDLGEPWIPTHLVPDPVPIAIEGGWPAKKMVPSPDVPCCHE